MKISKIIFLILVLTAFQNFGQNVTKDSVCVSLEIAKKIETDLNELDRIKENNTEENLVTCIEVNEQLSDVNNNLKSIVSQKDIQLEAKEDNIKILESQLQQESKKGNGLLWGVGGAAVGIVVTLILLR